MLRELVDEREDIRREATRLLVYAYTTGNRRSRTEEFWNYLVQRLGRLHLLIEARSVKQSEVLSSLQVCSENEVVM